MKITEYIYLGVAIFLTEEAIRTWGSEGSNSYVLLALGVLALLMYFFKRWYRKKIERENSN